METPQVVGDSPRRVLIDASGRLCGVVMRSPSASPNSLGSRLVLSFTGSGSLGELLNSSKSAKSFSVEEAQAWHPLYSVVHRVKRVIP